MTDEDNNLAGLPDEFTPAERAQFDAMRSGKAPEPAEKATEAAPEAEEAEDAAEPSEGAQQTAEKPKDPIHQAMHEERERRKAVQKERDDLRKQLEDQRISQARLEERTNVLLQQWQAAQKPAQPAAEEIVPPDPSLDPIASVEYQQRKLSDLEKRMAEADRVSQQRAALENVKRITIAAETEYRKTTPDYDAAVSHLVNARVRELQAWGATPEQAQAIVQQDAINLAAEAIQRRKNPAELAYQTAQARGYVKKEPEPAKTQETDNLARVEAGQAASRGLSGAGSKSGGVEIDATSLAKMSDEEFDAFRRKNPAKFRRLMGAEA